ncbi:MAG TPA: phosphodiester glycosidase family protein [Bosea sp. (in: a-proteobacteria)]
MVWALLALSLTGVSLGAVVFYSKHGLYGVNVLLRRGGSYFVTVSRDDQRLSPSMRLGLQQPLPVVTSPAPEWTVRSPGLATAELPVLAGSVEVDRILLTRIDPSHFRFEVLTAPVGNIELGDWINDRKPTVVVNGSYFNVKGYPDTPLKSRGIAQGPPQYSATHGVFAAWADGRVSIEDLRQQPWQPIVAAATDAMVSYPLLVGLDGSTRVRSDARWLANRSFVAKDHSGRIVIGTTKEAFFSLERLGIHLREAPLDLAIVLNLDGGPLACQAVLAPGFERNFCGDWETQTSGENIILLKRVIGHRRWALPIVLAAFPR